jgi:hypothetical protein
MATIGTSGLPGKEKTERTEILRRIILTLIKTQQDFHSIFPPDAIFYRKLFVMRFVLDRSRVKMSRDCHKQSHKPMDIGAGDPSNQSCGFAVKTLLGFSTRFGFKSVPTRPTIMPPVSLGFVWDTQNKQTEQDSAQLIFPVHQLGLGLVCTDNSSRCCCNSSRRKERRK